MKDIVANRRKLGLRKKLVIARIAVRENGLLWVLLLGAYLGFSRVADWAHGGMIGLRQRRGLPGLNSRALNRAIWEGWDWSGGGEEWTVSEPWKTALIEEVLDRLVPEGAAVLEIGPGAGRWTEPLLARAGHLTGVDISADCVALCRRRFGETGRAEFHVTDGASLSMVADASIDRVWSFDVFVHINAAEVGSYLGEIARVLRPGGLAVLHHGGVGGAEGGWRSDLTAGRMEGLVAAAGLVATEEIAAWGPEGEHGLSYGDRLSVLSRPADGRPDERGERAPGRAAAAAEA